MAFVTGSLDEQVVWQHVASLYWPGALTLVLPASDRVPRAMNLANPTTIGLRVPNAATARGILSQLGLSPPLAPICQGQLPLKTMAEIEAEFPDVLILPIELEAIKPELMSFHCC
jgi:L-threonylcarbamoyladenylate synthase